MRGAPSIRFRAAVALSLVVTLLWLASAALTTRVLTGEMNEVFDSALQETGQRILQLAVIDVLGREDDGVTQYITALDEHQEYFTYLVRDERGRILLASHTADPATFPTMQGSGFFETEAFRFYQEKAVQGTVVLTIAEPMSHRNSVSQEMALSLALPLLAVIPLSILGIFYGIGFGLRPLGQMRDQLARRNANDLAPVPTEGLPAELQPIAGTVNQLFQRLEGAFEAERSFASNAAHELRTPLAGALAQVQRLRQQTHEPETARRADEISGTLKRLTRLSERLMQLARAEGGRLIAAAPYDLRMILRLVTEDTARGSDADRVRLSLPATPVMSVVDADTVAIVARNLLENALRHGDDSPITLTLSESCWLTVDNTCPPLVPAVLEALTGRFVRGDDAGSGSGLGLAIVRTIADRIGAPLHLFSPIPGQKDGFRVSIQLTHHDTPLADLDSHSRN